jgi:hypothetical protein
MVNRKNRRSKWEDDFLRQRAGGEKPWDSYIIEPVLVRWTFGMEE